MGEQSLYQLKVTLKESDPLIWRRLLVPGGTRLPRLHRILQIAMGWQDYHLHAFTIDGERYSIPDPEDWTPVRNERRVTLAQVIPDEGHTFVYEYDFGDCWEHEIEVERFVAPEEHVRYPLLHRRSTRVSA